MLEVRLFGRPELSADGRTLAFNAPQRAFSILAYLLLHREQRLARDAVAFVFWPDVTEAEARTKLRAHLHYLSKEALPRRESPWFLADKKTVQWNPIAPVQVDVLEFERFAASVESYSQAVELYSGDLLTGFEDEWLHAPRARLHESQIAMLVELMRSSRASGEDDRSLLYGRRLLEMDPWREDVIRELMLLRAERGDRARALLIYRDFAESLSTELGVEPMVETAELYERISQGASIAGSERVRPPSPRTNLPSYLTSFIDRNAEVASLQETLGSRRLVTLTGTGGVGKTRLAVETARSIADRFPDGAWLVEFAAISDDGLILPAIADALGLVDSSETAVIAALRHRSLLLVLDNCEHLRGISPVAMRLVQECPGVRILATGREPLRITGERVERLPSLATPFVNGESPPFEQLAQAPAVQLFLERAADVAPPIELSDTTGDVRNAVASIAQRLDGIPLAIELAAARTGGLGILALAQRLDDRFSLLTAGSGASLPRHQTLRATLDWSFSLLSEAEQRVFARLGIFTGGWTLRAACAVCADLGMGLWAFEDLIGSLVDKSLINAERTNEDIRYRMLETMREYALERLEPPEREIAARNHARILAAIACEGETYGIRDGQWFKALKPDLQNVRAAMKWAITERNDPACGVALAEAFALFAYNTALAAEAVKWCDEALAAIGSDAPPELEARVQLAGAVARDFMRYASPTMPVASRAMDLFRALGDQKNLAYAAYFFANALYRKGEGREAGAWIDEALVIARRVGAARLLARLLIVKARAMPRDAVEERLQLLRESARTFEANGDRHGVFSALIQLGEAAFEGGDADAALRYAHECIPMLSQDVETEQHPFAVVQNNAAAYAIALGRYDEGLAYARDALAVAYRMGDQLLMVYSLQYVAAVALARGDAKQAARLLGAANARIDPLVEPRSAFTDRASYEQLLARLKNVLPAEELAASMAEGDAWRSGEAVARAMQV